MKNCSAGYDGIKSNFLKTNIKFFTSILVILINKIFSTQIFPDCLKISRLKPIHKDGSSTDASNYRPISITSVFSKLFETIMSIQLTEYLLKNNLINGLQFGFMKNSSTTNAAVTLINSIIKNLEDNLCTGTLFIDI